MYLKKLDITGFKSFAHHTQMTFGQGITGIVGPNGCGKSNIGDAVRWVLGEQNARTLRGGKMQDIIFSGTESRKPLSYCEVSMTFDNSGGLLPVAYSEVMITRRVYRSGESEYYLNKTACRLKDIIDLLRDTGIGKEGYSLIGQGRIDEILSARSEDRRAIFEEAAGISKYKARKDEAARRIEHTEQNLVRVEDILEELSGQLAPLAQQAESARRFLALSAELKSLELNDFLYKHNHFGQTTLTFAQARDALHEEGAQAEQDTLRLRQSIQAAQEAITQMEETMAVQHAQELELTRLTQMQQGQLTLLREREEQAQRDGARLAQEGDEDAKKLHALTAQKEGRPEASEALLAALRDALAQSETCVEHLAQEVALADTALETRKADIIDNMNRMTDHKAAHARMSAMREGLQGRLAALEGSEGAGQLADAATAAQEAQSRHAQAVARLDALLHETARAQEEATHCAQARDESAALLQRTREALGEANARLAMLRQMEKDYEGYQHSVREVMRRAHAAGDQGILGVVAEVLTVPKEYERAIEMTLGGQLQHIICRNQEDAKRHIDYLRTQRAGRATFLPLDAVRPRTLSNNERACLSMPGCLGVASELLTYDALYRPIIENLLARTVIAKDLDSGIAIMRKAGHSFRLVTLQGDVMHSGGSMTGGSVQSRMTSLLSRERELGEYEQAAQRLSTREAQALQDAAQAEETLRAAHEACSVLQAARHEQEITIEREGSHLQRAEEQLEEKRTLEEKTSLEREQLDAAIADIDQELRALNHQGGAHQEGAKQAQQEVLVASAALQVSREKLEALRADISAQRVQLASRQSEHEAAQRDEARTEQQMEELTAAAAQRGVLLAQLSAEAGGRDEAMAHAQAALTREGASLEAIKQSARTSEIEKVKLQQALRAHGQEQEAMRLRQEGSVDKLHKIQVQEARLQADLENLTARIWDSYELTYAGAQAFALADFDAAPAAKRIQDIRSETRAMGQVNTGAVEDFQATQARHQDLHGQREDLVNARKDLSDIVEKLTAKMSKLFTAQFTVINKNFNESFVALFGGGRAELRLADAANPLSSGIDIVAQPPGKKLQLLSLLSGGERALTAIAILFAMLKVKPTPFCILDEIEAALDESNVANFANFLAHYAKSTQFIVVTHRKGTMERCDALYGISMQEKGISSMISVELSSVDDLKNAN